MHARSLVQRTFAIRANAVELQSFAWIALLTAGVLAIYAPTTWSMVSIWRRSETFAHGFTVIPVFLYFVWTRRSALAALPMRPFSPGLVLVAGAGFLWLLGELAGTLAPAQFALIGFIPALILTLFGWSWLRALLFPCAFLFFAVPFGEFLIPILIQWTADVTVAALRLTGIPVYQEASHFVIPSGRWSVVQACSGIRYLIACAMTGCLFAALVYRSLVRQFVFVAVALVVPLVANWLRAYGIVLLGHLSENRLATGVDHLIYGWLFFGIVVFVLFAIGSRWREDEPAQDRSSHLEPALAPKVGDSSGNRPTFGVLVTAALLSSVWPIAQAALMAPLGGALPTTLAVKLAQGWEIGGSAISNWSASMQRPALRPAAYAFSKDGRAVGVQVGIYRDQAEGSELITSSNQLIADNETSGWRIVQQRGNRKSERSGAVEYRETLLKGDALLTVRDWYWLGERTTRSDILAKIDLAIDRLLRRDDTSAWIIIYTPVSDERDDGQVLDDFMREMAPNLEAALRGLRR